MSQIINNVSRDRSLQSPRLRQLQTELASGTPAILAKFWREIEEHQSPLIEPLPHGREALVTFLWRGDDSLENVVVFSSLTGWNFEHNQLTSLPHSDVWYGTYPAPLDLRATYWVSPNDSLAAPQEVEDWTLRTTGWQRDPLNRKTYRDLWYTEEEPTEKIISVLELPEAPPQPWVLQRPGVSAGTVVEHTVRSRILGNERKVWVYTPAGYTTSSQECDALVVFDGHAYTHLIPTPTILDNLIVEGRIPPVVAIMPDNMASTREQELTCSPKFVDFLAEELLPWARTLYRVTNDPARTIVAGSSYGGLAAAFASMTRPDVFGNVLSQSGSFWWKPETDKEFEWTAHQFSEKPLLPLHFYLDVGTLETDGPPNGPSQIECNRHLRDSLEAKGYPVHYAEFIGGHDTLCWQGTLADGLQALLGTTSE